MTRSDGDEPVWGPHLIKRPFDCAKAFERYPLSEEDSKWWQRAVPAMLAAFKAQEAAFESDEQKRKKENANVSHPNAGE
jgi:hypothetical protein